MKKIKKYSLLLILFLAAFVIFSCTKDEDGPVTPSDETGNDDVEAVLIDTWDYYQIENDSAGTRNGVKIGDNRGNYPELVSENYLKIFTHKVVVNEETLGGEDNNGIIVKDNQIYYLDENDQENYAYDYFYNAKTEALWLKGDTADTLTFDFDPFEVPDTLMVNFDEFMLFYRNQQGPRLTLLQPIIDFIIPDEDEDDLDDLTPKFKWEIFPNAVEYVIQVRNDSLFEGSDPESFVIIDTIAAASYEVSNDLENFKSFYWRVKADNSAWSNIWVFHTRKVVELLNPQNNKVVGLRPTINWEEFNDAENYHLQISNDENDFDERELIVDIEQTGTEYIPAIDNFSENTKYYWRVKSDNTEGFWSKVRNFKTERRVKLATPLPLETEVTNPIEFTWDELDNASSYTIQVCLDNEFTDLVVDSTLGISDNYEADLDVNNVYYWRVDCDVAADWSDTLRFQTNNYPFLSSPENESVDVGVIPDFKWIEYNGADSYTLQVATDDNFTDLIIDEIGIEDTVVVLDTDFEGNQTYYWRVQPDNLRDWSEIWSFTTYDITEQVTLLTPTENQEGVYQIPEFTWNPFTGSSLFRIQISDVEDFSNLIINKTTSSESYDLSEDDMLNEQEMLILGNSYYFRVRCDLSIWSATRMFTVTTGIPYDVEAEALSVFKVDLNWKDSAQEETEFLVEVAESLEGDWTELGSVGQNVTEFVDFDKEPNMTYYYRIRVNTPVGYSDYCEPVSVTTLNFSFDSYPELVPVPAGDFEMGSNNGEADEQPVHNILLTHDFEIGKYEVTIGQYADVLNWALGKGKIKGLYDTNMNYADDAVDVGSILKDTELECGVCFDEDEKYFVLQSGIENKPMTDIKWQGAAVYTNWLSQIEGINSLYNTSNWSCSVYDGGNGYRLPTEAEWEYFARYNAADNDWTYPWGETEPNGDLANYFNSGNGNMSLDVGSLPAGNSYLGASDIAGNVWEWCNDKYDSEFYLESPGEDPVGPGGSISGTTRIVIRGGSWEFGPDYLRNTNRSNCKADLNIGRVTTYIGFRILKINP